jgi:serine/threonine protein kinase
MCCFLCVWIGSFMHLCCSLIVLTHCFYVVLSFAEGGELFARVAAKGKLEESESRHYMVQVCLFVLFVVFTLFLEILI